MKKLKKNHTLAQRQVDYLTYIKETQGITHSEYLRRLIDREIDNDAEYAEYIRLRGGK